MEVKKVFVNKYQNGKLLGFANILFGLGGEEAALTIDGFKIFKSDKGGIQVVTPSKQDKEGKWQPLIKINVETPEGKTLMDEICQKVEQQYNYISSDRYEKKSTSKATDDFNEGIEDQDLPF